ncbi:MAG: hypothetical protein E6Y02_03035 [Gemella haemolysans]|nr:hypothetical protein [Gemella haemolysans]
MIQKIDKVFFQEDVIKIIVLNILLNEFEESKLSFKMKQGKVVPTYKKKVKMRYR